MLPASLAALRLHSRLFVDLEDLRRWDDRLRASPRPTLTVTSPVVVCNLDMLTRLPETVNDDTVRALYAEQLISKLPAGFGALEMHATAIKLCFSDPVPAPTAEVAAQNLGQFYAKAPASYRMFSLFWADDEPLFVRLAWPMPDEAKYPIVGFSGAEALAMHLQRYLVEHDMNAAAVSEPTQGVVVTRP